MYTNDETQNSAVLQDNIAWSRPVLKDVTGKCDVVIKLQLAEAQTGVEVGRCGLTLADSTLTLTPG